nr:methyltransferase [Aspergillus sp.]
MARTEVSFGIDTEELARLYETVCEHQFQAGLVLLGQLSLAPGEHVLDVGAGTGKLAAHAAEIVGESGRVVGIDPLPARINIANESAQANLSFAVGDAHDLSRFAPASFDVVYLNAVFHWLSDKPEALRQFARVLKPGGRLGITTGSGDHQFPHETVRDRVLARDPYRAYQDGGSKGQAQLVTKKQLEGYLMGAGFHTGPVTEIPNVVCTKDADTMIDFVESSSFGNYLGHLPEDMRAMVRREIVREYEAFRTGDGICADAKELLVVGTLSP